MVIKSEIWTIRAFSQSDSDAVADLFIRINRLLAPKEMEAAFEAYIQRSLKEEISRIDDYYSEHCGLFYVAEASGPLCGMFGLESAGEGAMELRRMYVAPEARGQGLGRLLLAKAETLALEAGCSKLKLSTSEIQKAALSLYRSAGYTLVAEEIAQSATLKTVGGNIRRFYFEKDLTVKGQ